MNRIYIILDYCYYCIFWSLLELISFFQIIAIILFFNALLPLISLLAIIVSSNSNNSNNFNTFAMLHDGHADTLAHFITYHGTIPMPTRWQTTSGIHSRHPACCRRVRPERGCAGGVESSPCRLRVNLAVSPGYSVLVWRTQPVSCSRAHIKSENHPIQAILKNSFKVNNFHKLNNSNDIFNLYNCKNRT